MDLPPQGRVSRVPMRAIESRMGTMLRAVALCSVLIAVWALLFRAQPASGLTAPHG